MSSDWGSNDVNWAGVGRDQRLGLVGTTSDLCSLRLHRMIAKAFGSSLSLSLSLSLHGRQFRRLTQVPVSFPWTVCRGKNRGDQKRNVHLSYCCINCTSDVGNAGSLLASQEACQSAITFSLPLHSSVKKKEKRCLVWWASLLIQGCKGYWMVRMPSKVRSDCKELSFCMWKAMSSSTKGQISRGDAVRPQEK